MASYCALALAGLLHFVIGVTIFITPGTKSCSPAPVLASWISIGGILMIIGNLNLNYPWYTRLPHGLQVIVEVGILLGLLEFYSLVIWCKLERLLYLILRHILLTLGMSESAYLTYEYGMLAVATTLMALALCFVVKLATSTSFFVESERDPMIYLNMELYEEVVSRKKQRMRRVLLH
ncbi:uncharacterized protein Dwil_GK27477 [Drosophila willistoni]|uniref:Uncharacterized protein n=1 Tax=Drosophila willistoni TaxID=7260 RepID=A0A0Q9WTT8_DROWI|nr:uncharacterized protein LOC26529479 [Drosophila willistoni]KRF99316.1 uncharacterized protein Dwil_GK27477 [Drosophila willistoni]